MNENNLVGNQKFISERERRNIQTVPNKSITVQPAATKEKVVMLTEQEAKQFGNRCPSGYSKIKILGKGGIAVVWLGVKDGVQVAMKQFPKQ